MPRLRGSACVLAVLLVAGCGSSARSSRRAAVDEYLDAVRHAQVDLVADQGTIDLALQSFSVTRFSPQEVRRLRAARATVATALRRVRALDTPPDASKVRALLGAHLALQRDLLDELTTTLLDVRRLLAAGAVSSAAAVRLRRDLAAAAAAPPTTVVPIGRGPEGSALDRYAQAFGRYGDSLRPLASRLAAAPTPSLLAPTIGAKRGAITRSVALGDRIRSELAARRISAANRDIHALLVVAASLNGLATRRAEARAARAYDKKIRRIGLLERRLAQERTRLIRVVG